MYYSVWSQFKYIHFLVKCSLVDKHEVVVCELKTLYHIFYQVIRDVIQVSLILIRSKINRWGCLIGLMHACMHMLGKTGLAQNLH